ncbi:hypothetical protein [Nostoc sp.]
MTKTKSAIAPPINLSNSLVLYQVRIISYDSHSHCTPPRKQEGR